MAGSGRFLINALLGRRVKDKFDDKDAPERQRSLDAVDREHETARGFLAAAQARQEFLAGIRFGNGRGYGRVQADVRAHETAGLAGRSARDFPYRRFQSFRRIFPDGRARRHDPQDCGEVAARNAECRAGRDAGSPGRRHVDPGGVAEAITARIAASGDQFYGLALERVAEVVASNETWNACAA